MLKNIDIRFELGIKYKEGYAFLTEFFYEKIKASKKIQIDKFSYITIILCKEDKQEKIKIYGNFIEYNVFFDFSVYETLSNIYEKKKYVLEVSYSTCCTLCDIYGWDKAYFTMLYDYCMANNIEYKKIYTNTACKHLSSQYYFSVLQDSTPYSYDVHLVIFDGKGEELNRILILRYYTEVWIEWAKFDEIEQDKIVYKFKDKDKIFYLNLSEFLTEKSVKIHKNYKKWWI